jgi:hypothetical protein
MQVQPVSLIPSKPVPSYLLQGKDHCKIYHSLTPHQQEEPLNQIMAEIKQMRTETHELKAMFQSSLQRSPRLNTKSANTKSARSSVSSQRCQKPSIKKSQSVPKLEENYSILKKDTSSRMQ